MLDHRTSRPDNNRDDESKATGWHEVRAAVIKGTPGLILVSQLDVTERVELEELTSQLIATQGVLLKRIFPRHVLDMVASHEVIDEAVMGSMARVHPSATIMFLDIVGYTSMSRRVGPSTVMTYLNQLFGHLDYLCDKHDVHKLEVAGDCYIVCAGILWADREAGHTVLVETPDAAADCARMFAFAKDAIQGAHAICIPHSDAPTRVRVGIHHGPCSSGIISLRQPKFTVFGDTMNTASRMESTGVPDGVQMSDTTYAILAPSVRHIETDGVFYPKRDGVEVKGIGHMKTVIWKPLPAFFQPVLPSPGSSGVGHHDDHEHEPDIKLLMRLGISLSANIDNRGSFENLRHRSFEQTIDMYSQSQCTQQKQRHRPPRKTESSVSYPAGTQVVRQHGATGCDRVCDT